MFGIPCAFRLGCRAHREGAEPLRLPSMYPVGVAKRYHPDTASFFAPPAFGPGVRKPGPDMTDGKPDLVGLIKMLVSPTGLEGEINPTQFDFITAMDEVKWYTGPAGCAKTTSLMASVILPALLMPGSRWLIARHESTTLRETTMLEFDAMLKRISPDGSIIVREIQTPFRKVWIRPAVPAPDGKEYWSEFIFRGLDEAEKFGSLQVTGIAVDEADEIPRKMVEALLMRLRYRLPWQKSGPPSGPFFLNMVSNPPSKAHWLHLAFCQEEGCDPQPMGRKFTPHPRENAKNLPDGYYDKRAAGMSHEMKERLIHGRCGPTTSGKAVFKDDFNYELHVKSGLKPIQGLPMIRGWDFGRRRPSCVWSQVTPEGWHNRFRAILGENESTRAFAQRVEQISRMMYPWCHDWVDFCDPHGDAKQSTSDKSDVDILREEGFRPQWRSVSWDRGLDYMAEELTTLRKGRPVAAFDREGCAMLIEGYSSGYKYPLEKPDRELKPKPVKDGLYEHLMDADRYTVVCLKLGATVEASKHLPNLRYSRTGR